MSVGKGKRFRVFMRDGFRCRYCGRRPPEVELECDHIQPRSRGGSDKEINLTTACKDCNAGKSDVEMGIRSPIDNRLSIAALFDIAMLDPDPERRKLADALAQPRARALFQRHEIANGN